MAAATLAVGLHCRRYILDRNLERLRQVDHHFRGALETVASSTHAIEETPDADIVIGAVLVVGARAPKLVSDALVARMRPGSVLVDISVDQGGCFESTHPTTHSHPTFAVEDSLFYCVANMPGAVPHSSTHALVMPRSLTSSRSPNTDGGAPWDGARAGRGGQRGRGLGDLRTGGRRPWPPLDPALPFCDSYFVIISRLGGTRGASGRLLAGGIIMGLRVGRWAAVAGTALSVVTATGLTAAGSAARAAISPTAVLIHPDEIYAGTASNAPPTLAQCETTYLVACYGPTQIERAYDLPALYATGITGKGQTIIIVDSYGSPTIGHDLNVFDRTYGCRPHRRSP